MSINPLIIYAAVIGIILFVLIGLKIKKDLTWGVYAVLFFLPFERIPTLEIAGFTAKINHLVGLLLIGFWIINRIAQKNREKFHPIIFWWLGLLSIFATSIFIAGMKGRSIVAFVTIAFCVMLAYVILDTIKSRRQLYGAENVIIIISWIMIGLGFIQIIGDMAGIPPQTLGLLPSYSKLVLGFPRAQALLKEPLYFGNFLLIPFGIVMGRIIGKRFSRLDIFLALAISLMILLTVSRGAIFGLLVCLLILGLLSIKRIFNSRNIALMTVSGLAGLIILTFLYFNVDLLLREKFTDHLFVKDYGKSESTAGRLGWANDAISIWIDHPLMGVGLANFGPYKSGFDKESAESNRIVNNEYLELLAENGVVGFGFFMLMIAAIFAYSLKAYLRAKDQALKALIISTNAALVGILVQYNFFSTLGIIHIWLMFSLVLAVSKIALDEPFMKEIYEK